MDASNTQFLELEQHFLNACPFTFSGDTNAPDIEARTAWYAFGREVSRTAANLRNRKAVQDNAFEQLVEKALQSGDVPEEGAQSDQLVALRAFFMGCSKTSAKLVGAGPIKIGLNLSRPRKVGQGPCLKLEGQNKVHLQLEPNVFELVDTYFELVCSSAVAHEAHKGTSNTVDSLRRAFVDAEGRFEGGECALGQVDDAKSAYAAAAQANRTEAGQIESSDSLVRDAREDIANVIIRQLNQGNKRHAWLAPIIPALVDFKLSEMRSTPAVGRTPAHPTPAVR